jgi:hypothetical protein
MSPELVIDVAHPPRSAEVVEETLDEAVRHVRASNDLRVIKVIHGYGSSGKGGTTREVVRNWAFRHRKQLAGIINGEEHSFNLQLSSEMRAAVGQYPDRDLSAHNPGITLLWVK